MSNLIDIIYKSIQEYTNKMRREPTHIIMSYSLVNDLYLDPRQFKYIRHDNINKVLYVLGLKVIPTTLNILDGDSNKFILVSDETSDNFDKPCILPLR